MKLHEAINRADIAKPNSFSTEEKVQWLSTLDGIIKTKIIDTHEGGDGVVFNGYTAETHSETELLVPAPFDDIYIYYIEMKLDYANGEEAKYRNSATLYNNAYTEYFKYYNSKNRPKHEASRFRF